MKVKLKVLKLTFAEMNRIYGVVEEFILQKIQ